MSRVALRDTRSGRRIAGNNCPQARNLASYLEANPWMEVWQGVQYMFKCTCIDMYACTHVHVYMYMHTHIHIDTHIHIQIYTYGGSLPHILRPIRGWGCIYMYTCTHMHLYTGSCVLICTHSSIQDVFVCVYTHTHAHTHNTHTTHTHTHSLSLTHTHTHRCGRGVLRMRYLHPLAQTCLESQPENTTKCTNYHNCTNCKARHTHTHTHTHTQPTPHNKEV